MARLFGITYAGLTVGLNATSTSYELTGPYDYSQDHESLAVAFDVIVSHATTATFLSDEAALLLAYRTPDAALIVMLGASTRHTFNTADGTNTGLLTKATIRKLAGRANYARYRCSVSGQLPATLNSRLGRREARISVEELPSERKRVRVSGVYTAVTTLSARAQFEAQVATWAATVLTDLGGTFEIESTVYDYGDQNKVLNFSRVYLQVIGNQGVGTLDVSSLVNPSLILTRRAQAAEGAIGAGVELPVEVTARYTTWVKKSVTQDLVTLYATTVRPHIVSQAGGVAGGTVVILADEPQYDFDDNRISATVRLIGIGGPILALRVRTEEYLDFGYAIYPVFGGDSFFDADVYQGPATHLVNVIRTAVARTGRLPANLGLPTLPGNFLLVVRERPTRELYEQGLPGERLELESVVDVFRYRRVGKAEPAGPVIIPVTETV